MSTGAGASVLPRATHPWLRLNAVAPYYTMFPLEFPYDALAKARPEEWVLDPFCGRGTTLFAARLRRVPHVGAKVAFLPTDLLAEILGSGDPDRGAVLGYLAFGEFVFAGNDPRLAPQDWVRAMHPAIIARFDIAQLVSRRSFVFARAGFGKSNLVKLLFSGLYGADRPPTVTKRGQVKVPVGTIVFDPDGEYFWPDDKDRPGLCDVPELHDRIVVFTDRKPPSDFYGSFVVDG